MNVLIGQPIHENRLLQLENVLRKVDDIDIVLFPEGYLSEESLIGDLKRLAQKYKVIVITSYKDSNNKDRVIIVGKEGDIVLERAKTPVESQRLDESILLQPSKIETEFGTIGIVLCMEIFFNSEDLQDVDYIFNPIGVGMFSKEQYQEWTSRAKDIAISKNAMIIGASHADGFYRDYKVSIPLSYVIDKNGEEILMTENDTYYRVVNTDNGKINVVKDANIS